VRSAVAILAGCTVLAGCGGNNGDGDGGEARRKPPPSAPTYEQVKAAALATPQVRGNCDPVEETRDIPDVPEENLPAHRRVVVLYCTGDLLVDYMEFETEKGALEAIEARELDVLRPPLKPRFYAYFVNRNVVVVPGAPDVGGGDPIPATAIAGSIQRRCRCGEVKLPR
jgi:hypothetical protein